MRLPTQLLLIAPLFVACNEDSSDDSPSTPDPPTGEDHYVHETDVGLDFPNGCTCSAPTLGALSAGDQWTIEGVVGHMWTHADSADSFKFSGSDTEAFLIEFTLVPLTNSAESDIDFIAPGFFSSDDELPLESAVESGSFTVDAFTSEVGMKIQNAGIDSEWRLVFTVTSVAPLSEEPPRATPVRVLWIAPDGQATCTLHFPPVE